jgi:hypothetical protein
LTWAPRAQPLTANRRDPPVLLSLLLSALATISGAVWTQRRPKRLDPALATQLSQLG